MYNMEITIGSYKCRMEICILIVILFWIMFGHVMCSCCTMSMQEGLETMKNVVKGKKEGYVAAPVARRRADNVYDANHPVEETDAFSMNKKEGFVSSNNKAYGPEFGSSKTPGYIMRPDTWAQPTLSYSMGTTPSAGAQAILNRNNPPLNEGQLDFFAKTPFKPECCPNTYSSSEGCACMDMNQYSELRTRSKNNIPYSEY